MDGSRWWDEGPSNGRGADPAGPGVTRPSVDQHDDALLAPGSERRNGAHPSLESSWLGTSCGPRRQESKERSMIYRRSRESRVVGALAALGFGFGGCADKVAAPSSAGAGVATTDDGGRQRALGTGGDPGARGIGGTAGASGTGGSSAGARDAAVEANSPFAIGAPCDASDGWQEPVSPFDGGPRVWTDLGPGVGWCDMNPLQKNYPKGSWTVTCESDSDCPSPSACDPSSPDHIGTCRELCHSDAECIPPSTAPTAGYATSCACPAYAQGHCFCGITLIKPPPP